MPMQPDLSATCSHLPSADIPNPLGLDDDWLTETVLALSRGIATENALDRLPILADALEEAGCDNEGLLNHLRYCEHHRVECWALRRLLWTKLVLPSGIEMPFVYCPPGSFLMGSPESEEGRSGDELQHEVRLTKGFYAGVHPVTQAEWRAVMGTNPSDFKGINEPVEKVNWEDAQEFCVKIQDVTGKMVRLPTEAEWEYACRSGTTTPFYWGKDLNGTQANCDGKQPYGTERTGPSFKPTSPVGRYAKKFPHPWGLTDVTGNVWEWCLDWYDEGFYARSPKDDPECRDGEKRYHVLRGGSWIKPAHFCRSAYRHWVGPHVRDDSFGFRVVFSMD
jgi:formylglycine-generating enzyme required for sulfatase activity